MELRGRVALVTGAGRRLGQELARALAGRGMTLAIHHHASAEGARALRDEVASAAGAPSASPPTSPMPRPPAALPGRVADAFGRLDVLVNSAAVMHRLGFEETTPEQYDAILDLNLRSVFFCTQGAAPALRAARGKVVNIADLAGLQPWPGFAAHSVSKAGVVMLTKVLARSLAPEVTVNAIAPGRRAGARGVRRARSESGWPEPRRWAASAARETWSRRCSTSWKAATSSPAKC